MKSEFLVDGKLFDHLFMPHELFFIGRLPAQALHVAGYTPADMAYKIGNTVFVGDTLFMPDVGTARCDFPGGDAHQLYRSIHKLLSLPVDTVLYICHDYPPPSREPLWRTSVADQRRTNIPVHDDVSEAEFVTMREKRDAHLGYARFNTAIDSSQY